MNRIRKLLTRVRELSESSENVRRWSYWDEAAPPDAYDMHRYIPKRVTPNVVPFVVEFEPTCFAKISGYDPDEYYNSPDCYLLNFLSNSIYKFESLSLFTN